MGGRALNDGGYLGCDRLGCRGPVRREAVIELVFREEQQALARAAVFHIDVPGPHGGPCAAHFQDAVVWRAGDASCQGVRALLIHAFNTYLPVPHLRIYGRAC